MHPRNCSSRILVAELSRVQSRRWLVELASASVFWVSMRWLSRTTLHWGRNHDERRYRTRRTRILRSIPPSHHACGVRYALDRSRPESIISISCFTALHAPKAITTKEQVHDPCLAFPCVSFLCSKGWKAIFANMKTTCVKPIASLLAMARQRSSL